MLTVRGLNHYYGGSHTLRDVDLEVSIGSCTALLGRNGVGKSTLLKCLMGVLPVRSGTIQFDGQDITTLAPHARARRGLAYVPQGREIFSRLTVEENLLTGFGHELFVAVGLAQQAAQLLIEFLQKVIGKAFLVNTNNQAFGFYFQ